MHRMFAKNKLTDLFKTSCTYSTKPEVITEICKKLAIKTGVIELRTLELCPPEKLTEISSLLDKQKHGPDALVFIQKHKLFKIDQLMACDLTTIQAYKGYLYNLDPVVADNGMALDLETFKNLPSTYQLAYSVPGTVDHEKNYFKPGCGG